MLADLTIKNFALIKEAKLRLTPGVNILTGETGAGKSIVIKALDMLLGGRASTDFIRQGEEKAMIEACFNIKNNSAAREQIKNLGLEVDQDQNIILTREIRHSGNNKSRINGRIVTLEMTRQISKYLIDIYGQHEHQSLLDPEEHLNLLDQFGGEELIDLRKDLKKIYNKLQYKKFRLSKLNKNEEERKQRIDLLEFQLSEIEDADLELGEAKELLVKRKKLSNAEELAQVVGAAYNQLYESDFNQEAIIDQVNQLAKEINNLVKLDKNLKDIGTALKDIKYSLEDISFKLRDYEDEIEFNPQKLEIIEERLNLINNLKRKYGDNIEEILNYRDKIKKELKELKNNKQEKESIKREIADLKDKYLKKAEVISDYRKEIAIELEGKIEDELRDLSMAQTKFSIHFKKSSKFMSTGIDEVEFLIATNLGSELKSLTKIASGGELSRIMLALKTITANNDEISTLIFDEIDSGIGGRVANLLAKKLIFLANNHQLVCITHLPQIACIADNHYLLNKNIVNGETITVAKSLNKEDQIREIARMLDGSLNMTTLEHAQELIESNN